MGAGAVAGAGGGRLNRGVGYYLQLPMEALAGLIANINRYVTLPPEAIAGLEACARVVHVRRRQFISQPGFTATTRNYVNQGAFRSYFLDQSGKEHTVQLSVEDWFISDFYSYITQTPGTLFIEAFEDGQLVQLPHAKIEPLIAQHIELSEYFRRTTERAFAFSRIRVQADLSATAEQRYLAFRDRYPEIVNRVPQYAVASYLGMTPEFLSKVRGRLAS